MQQITLTRPDDWHIHLRDGASLATTVRDATKQFGRAIVMPNLRPPVTTVEQAAGYRERILAAVPAGVKFEPLMTLYLTDNTPPDEIDRAKASGFVHAVKLYPAGATTNSDAGVTSLDKVSATLERMQTLGMPLLVHGEVTNADVDIFDRERVFIDRVFLPLQKTFPGLRTVFEHITTAEAAQFVSAAGDNVAATITAHHLLMNRNALFAGGIRPHHYCLPVLKAREASRSASSRRRFQAIHGFSWAPIPHRMPGVPRKRLAVAQGAIRPMPPSNCMPKPSIKRVRLISSKPSPATTGRTGMAWRGTASK